MSTMTNSLQVDLLLASSLFFSRHSPEVEPLRWLAAVVAMAYILWVFYSHTPKKLHTTQDKKDVSHPLFIERRMPMICRHIIQAFKVVVPTIDPLQNASCTLVPDQLSM